MKKCRLLVAVMMLSLVLNGCVMFAPDPAAIGEAKTFQKEGMSILLTDRFQEKESKTDFDAYYISDFCGVMIEAEPFNTETEPAAWMEEDPVDPEEESDDAEEDPLDTVEILADWTEADYLQYVIEKNGHTGMVPQEKDGLCYYVKETGNACLYVFAYKGSKVFLSVQFICMAADARFLKDTIYLFAQSVEIE